MCTKKDKTIQNSNIHDDAVVVAKIKKAYYDQLKKKTMMIPLNFSNVGKLGMIHNRKTHTLEVVEISKELSNKLINNKNFTFRIDNETLNNIAELHDIGHTPFGHIGEQTIRDLIRHKKELFREEYPGYFKHNIFSANIIIHYFNNPSWKLVDGVLKHSKIFDSNFVYFASKEENLIKMNYVFRREVFPDFVNEKENEFGLEFLFSSLGSYLTNKKVLCNQKCPNLILKSNTKGYCNICQCKKGSFVAGLLENNVQIKKKDLVISSYLTYNHPLSIEGSIVMIADEIASYLSDISDYFKYLKTNENKGELQYSYVLKRIQQELNRLKSNTKNNLLNNFCDYYERYVISLIEDNKVKINESKKELQSFLIACVDVVDPHYIKVIKDDILIANNKNKECSPLVYFNKDIIKGTSAIKKAVYELVHQTEVVKNGNNVAAECIKSLINIFYEKRNMFLEAYEKYTTFKKMHYDQDFSDFLFNSLLKIYKEYSNYDINYSKSKQKFKNQIITSDPISKCFLDAIDSKLTNEQFNMKANNVFYREICFFVASLNDTEAIDAFLNSYAQLKKKGNYKIVYQKIKFLTEK